jgi:cobalt-zinc-cadmium efflux system outer membrane protein
MRRRQWRARAYLLLLSAGFSTACLAQKPLTWEEVHERFRNNNPNLLAGRTFVEESRAVETTAGLRPNPVLSVIEDQFHVFHPNPLAPFQNTQLTHDVTQLIERRNKRQLRVESASLATSAATTDLADIERQLTFNLRDAFARTLQAKSVLELAQENLKYYDHVIEVNRERFKAGDVSRADLVRVELQRVQFESDLVNAEVNLRTAKIGLLALMNDRQPVDGFDVTGQFGFRESVPPLEDARRAALDARPDLKSAATAIERAKNDNRLAWANGSTDPTVGVEYQRTGPDNTVGLLVSIPLRIFDRNQGEKARTELEIQRTGRIRESIVTGIYRDVDSAYATVGSVAALLKPYRDRYLPQAVEVRETVSFAYQNGGASLLEFLDAQKSYRDVQLNYRNLIGSYLAAVNQLNLAVGREVIP